MNNVDYAYEVTTDSWKTFVRVEAPDPNTAAYRAANAYGIPEDEVVLVRAVGRGDFKWEKFRLVPNTDKYRWARKV